MEPADNQILINCPVISPKHEPLRLTKGHKMETSVWPNIGPMQAPKSLPPALIKDPKLLHKNAIPVARMPKKTQDGFKIS